MAAFVHDVLALVHPQARRRRGGGRVEGREGVGNGRSRAALEQRFSSFGRKLHRRRRTPITEIVVEGVGAGDAPPQPSPPHSTLRREHLHDLFGTRSSGRGRDCRTPVQIAMNEIQSAAQGRGERPGRGREDQILCAGGGGRGRRPRRRRRRWRRRRQRARRRGRRCTSARRFSEAVVEFDGAKVDMSERQVLDMMVMTQYVDTMKEIGGHPHSQVTIPVGQATPPPASRRR